jgi:hypothetical protein
LEIIIAPICDASILLKLKQKLSDFNDKTIKYTNITKNDSMILGDSKVTTHIYSGSDTINRETAVKNNLPIFNMTECEAALKSYYNITQDTDIIYVTNSYDSSLNSEDVNSYQIKAYNSQSKEQLDTSICNNIKQTVKMPISNITDFNLTHYNELKQQGIDIFDPKNRYLNDRCVTIDTEDDISLTQRRENYSQRKMPECFGLNCTYSGIDTDNYVECSCSGIQTDIEFINKPINFLLNSVTKLNIDLIGCVSAFPVNYFFI